MDNPTILVADGDPKNLQILRESLEASGFEVIVASDGLQAWQKISSDVPDLILSEVNLPKLDGFQLLEKLKADPVTSSIPLMFLTNRRELQDRVRSLRGGVKDYMIKPLHVKEVIARVRMILRRMERIREEEIETSRKLAGRLEEYSVIDLIESFGMERKTGVLTLYNVNNKSGEIYFRDGAVINASLGNLKAEKAVYQMLPWKRGHFTMTFKEINVPDEIAVSNLGLLLQGFKRMEERERLFKMLPSPETTFVTTETFRNILQKRQVTTDVANFIALIDGKRDILQIIDESTYDDIKTLERLVKLYQQGFIKPAKTAIPQEAESDDIASSLAEPRIVERLSVVQNRQQPVVGRRLPEPQEPPRTARPEMTRPTPAQAFRSPEPRPQEPAPAKWQDRPATPPEPQPKPPSPYSDSEADIPPRKPKIPDMIPVIPDSEDLASEPAQIFFEPLRDDAHPEEPDLPEEPPAFVTEKHDEELSSFKSLDQPEQSTGSKMREKAPEEPPVEPEHLPIDLSALMQRPVSPPPFVEEKPEPSPAEASFPAVKARTKEDSTPPVSKPVTVEPSAPLAPERVAEPPVAEKPPVTPPFSAPPVDDLPVAKATVGTGDELISRPTVAPPSTTKMQAPFVEERPPESRPFQEKPAPRAAEIKPQIEREIRATPEHEAPAAEVKVKSEIHARVVQEPPAPPQIEPIQEPMPEAKAKIGGEFKIVPPPEIIAPPKAVSEPVAPPVAPSELMPPSGDQIVSRLALLLENRTVTKPKLIVIGREGIHVSPVVRHLLGAESTLRRLESATFQYLEIGERKLADGRLFEVIGISMEQQFTRLLDAAGAEVVGYIVMVEAYRREELEYLSYLLNILRSIYRQPLGIAVIKSPEHKNMATETLRDLLNIAPTDFIRECTPTNKASVVEFLHGFTNEIHLLRGDSEVHSR